jgi:aminomethyltransferase
VQGPKAEAVVASIFGDWVKALKYFWFKETEINGIPVAVARSGWSKQGGFEIYLMDGKRGTEIWNIVREAGKPFDIGPGNPNVHERVESGLLSYGGDTDDFTNPFEVRMGKYVDLSVPDDTVGITALRQIKAEGVKRQQLGLVFDAEAAAGPSFTWFDIFAEGRKIGSLTNIIWSFRLKKTIGFALVSTEATAGDKVTVMRHGVPELATLCDLPFI